MDNEHGRVSSYPIWTVGGHRNMPVSTHFLWWKMEKQPFVSRQEASGTCWTVERVFWWFWRPWQAIISVLKMSQWNNFFTEQLNYYHPLECVLMQLGDWYLHVFRHKPTKTAELKRGRLKQTEYECEKEEDTNREIKKGERSISYAWGRAS